MILTDHITVGIVGSRCRDSESDLQEVRHALIKVLEQNPGKTIDLVSGGCPEGGDRFAEILATELSLPIHIHYPDKSKLPEKPKRWDFATINYARNTLIARDADILIACVASDRKGGTEDTIKKYMKMGKKNLILV